MKRGLAAFVAALAIAGAIGPLQPAHAAEQTPVGWHVPWAIGGPRIIDGDIVDTTPDRPASPVHSIRLWDTRTAWLHNQPAPDTYNWNNLDQHLKAAEEMGASHITLTLAGAPAWAADRADAEAAAWLGAGSNRPALNAGDWETYVRTVATRYRGRIHAYEIGNEANLRMFWTGTPEQHADRVAQAARVIRETDPAATIIAGGPVTHTRELPIDLRLWTNKYLTRLANIGADVDAHAIHYYPKRWSKGSLRAAIRDYAATIRTAGLPQAPVWVTEINSYDQTVTCANIARDAASAQRPGERFYMYAYGTGVMHDGMREADSACVAAGNSR